MNLEKTGDADHPYKLTFDEDEVEVVAAVFKEEIFQLARKGNTGSISGFDRYLASWEEGEQRSAKIIDAEDFAEKFEDFHQRTDESIIEIAQESATPPFMNNDIVYRYALGSKALKLAQAIREKAAPDLIIEDLDKAFSPLLGGDESNQQPEG
ncbi:hypothetical protein H0X09_03150 [Candidatus Saccharibacteria bacterium]|nr:hypothetical protein [Candidatus Saccharibacteria bacterium]